MKELETETTDPNFWKDTNRAKVVMKQIENIKKESNTARILTNDVNSLLELYDITGEKELLQEEYNSIYSGIKEFEKLKFLNGKYDSHDVLLSIHAGQGGTESNDWASMLLRMYQMFCDKKGWKYSIEDIIAGSKVGVSTATLRITGE